MPPRWRDEDRFALHGNLYVRDMLLTITTWYSYLYPFGDASVGLGGLLGQVYVGDDSSVAACVGASTCTVSTRENAARLCPQSVPPSDSPLPMATTAPLGPRLHAAHARASPRPSADESPRNPQVCTTVREGVRRASRSSSAAFHRLLPCHLALHLDYANGTQSSSLERCVCPPDADPRQKRALLAALLANHRALGAM